MIREFGVAPEDPVDVRFSSKLQDFVERSRHQDIVTVQEPDPVACRGIETGVARRTAAAVSLMQNLEPGIGRRERLRDFRRPQSGTRSASHPSGPGPRVTAAFPRASPRRYRPGQ